MKIELKRRYFVVNEVEHEFDYLLRELGHSPDDTVNIDVIELSVHGYVITERNDEKVKIIS